MLSWSNGTNKGIKMLLSHKSSLIGNGIPSLEFL